MQSQLTDLAARRLVAKRAEEAAAEIRKKIDKEIADLLATPDKKEGTVTEKLDGFKVSVEYGVTRKVDTKKLQAAWDTLPKAVQDSINWKADLSVSKFRDLDQDAVLVLSTYLESKPSTPSVKVEATE